MEEEEESEDEAGEKEQIENEDGENIGVKFELDESIISGLVPTLETLVGHCKFTDVAHFNTQ